MTRECSASVGGTEEVMYTMLSLMPVHCFNRLERVDATKQKLGERYLSVLSSLSCCHHVILGILRALPGSLEDLHMLDMSVLRMYIPQLGCEALWQAENDVWLPGFRMYTHQYLHVHRVV